MTAADTIVAAATPPGRGGVAIVRVSGPGVPRLAAALLGTLPEPRFATFTRWHDADAALIDTGLALYFPAPHSFTGEHVLELHGHGGAVVVESLIERAVQLGARRARPGEFTQRAFLNDKIDLAQAEAIADLIDAGSRTAAQAALRSLQGEFSQQVNAAREALTALRVYVEAAIDFPEEEIDFLDSQELRERVDFVQQKVDAVLEAARLGARLTRGLTVVIAGRPNAGKSTLLNRLVGHDAAIVTPVAGTTRDLLREQVEIGGVPMEIIDTAGLREATTDAIEGEGMRRARTALARADHILYVVDAAADPGARSLEEERESLPAGVPLTLVMNKSDLAGQGSKVAGGGPVLHTIAISAATGAGLDLLRAQLAAAAGHTEISGGTFSARTRHVEALTRAQQQLAAARKQLASKQGELAAFELRAAQASLGEVLGDVTSDELLGRIFSSFCIGK
jgi:tRNA modification GTPase